LYLQMGGLRRVAYRTPGCTAVVSVSHGLTSKFVSGCNLPTRCPFTTSAGPPESALRTWWRGIRCPGC